MNHHPLQSGLALARRLAVRCSGVSIALGLLLLQCTVCNATTGLQRSYGLVIGIDSYNSAHASGSKAHSIVELKSAVGDAKNFAALLVGAGMPSENIQRYVDEQASAKKIRAGMQWLQQKSEHADTVVFYFSGHGSSDVPDLDRDEETRDAKDGYDEALLPVDALDLTQQQASAIASDPELRKKFFNSVISDDEIHKFCAKCDCRVLLVVDACFSGGVFMSASGKAAADTGLLFKSAQLMRPADYPLLAKGRKAPAGDTGSGKLLDLPSNIACLAASQEGQPAVDDPRLKASWFTYGLSSATKNVENMKRADSNRDRRVSLAEAFSFSKQTIRELKKARTSTSPLLQLVADVPDQEPFALNLATAEELILASY